MATSKAARSAASSQSSAATGGGLYSTFDRVSEHGAAEARTAAAKRGSLLVYAAQVRAVLASELEKYEILHTLESTLKVRKIDLVSYAGVAFSLSLILGLGGRHWCEIVGFLYPARETLRGVCSARGGANRESTNRTFKTQWLTYWVTFAFFNLAEDFLGGSLFAVVPFYYSFKFGLLIWLQSPQKRGSLYLHSHILTPFLKRHEALPAATKAQSWQDKSRALNRTT
mmetsp:Transcript_12134/g.30870  ORF Transcript_12134/g.30870 Transcript_12134/m.30870 type:complete len:227 (-) Transcript_12134:1636-2316(-)